MNLAPRITAVLILLTSLHLMAQEHTDPSIFCDEIGFCTQSMLNITKGFKAGDTEFSKNKLSGFSGSCYYISPFYDQNHEHHGAFLFEKSPKALMATGIFSFFAEQDPYKEMNSVELKQWFINRNSRFSETIVTSNQVELRYLTEESDIHYWFRSSSDGKQIFIISRDVNINYLEFGFCKMDRR
jgi:hypothetical protein